MADGRFDKVKELFETYGIAPAEIPKVAQAIYDLVPAVVKETTSKEDCLVQFAPVYFGAKGIKPNDSIDEAASRAWQNVQDEMEKNVRLLTDEDLDRVITKLRTCDIYPEDVIPTLAKNFIALGVTCNPSYLPTYVEKYAKLYNSVPLARYRKFPDAPQRQYSKDAGVNDPIFAFIIDYAEAVAEYEHISKDAIDNNGSARLPMDIPCHDAEEARKAVDTVWQEEYAKDYDNKQPNA